MVRHPVGGVRTVFELGNGLTRLGHQVHLIHFPLAQDPTGSVDDVPWFEFETGIEHHFLAADGDFSALPAADFTMPAHAVMAEMLTMLRGVAVTPYPSDAGLPFNLVQGYGFLGPRLELPLFTLPCPKVCVGRWLIDVGRDLGVPEEQLVYVPNGIDHDVFRLVRPLAERPMQVTMLYHYHELKGTMFGLEALEEVKRRVPALQVELFGAFEPPDGLPEWIHVTRLPDQDVLVDRIYNQSRIMVSPSITEGFGYTSVEAMACGCALVTAANGGSEDFAFHNDTALVSAPRDVAAMADNIEALLLDDDRRIAMATRGLEQARLFDWATSSRLLEAFLVRYLDHPEIYSTEVFT